MVATEAKHGSATPRLRRSTSSLGHGCRRLKPSERRILRRRAALPLLFLPRLASPQAAPPGPNPVAAQHHLHSPPLAAHLQELALPPPLPLLPPSLLPSFFSLSRALFAGQEWTRTTTETAASNAAQPLATSPRPMGRWHHAVARPHMAVPYPFSFSGWTGCT